MPEEFMVMRKIVLVLGSSAQLALTSCSAEAPCAARFPAAADASSVHVSVCGDDGAGNGTAQKPLRTLGAALRSGARSIALGEGAYIEELPPIEAATQIVGYGRDSTHIENPPSAAQLRGVIEFSSAGQSSITGVSISGAAGAGIFAASTQLTLRHARIGGLRDPAARGFGHGAVVVDGSLDGQDVALDTNAGWGLVARRSAVSLDGFLASSNRSGGLAIVDRSPDGAAATLRGGTVSSNAVTGVASFGGFLHIEDTAVTGTVSGSSLGAGDGIVGVMLIGESGLGVRPVVDLLRGTVSGNARAGVLLDNAAGGSIQRALIGENGRAGLWLQGSSTRGAGQAPTAVAVSESTFQGNTASGIVATSGAMLRLAASTVGGTKGANLLDGLGSVRVGDGLSVFDGASADVSASTFGTNDRVAIVLDGAASTSRFVGNQVTMAGDSVVIQGATQGAVTFSSTENTLGAGARVVDVGAARSLGTVRASIGVPLQHRKNGVLPWSDKCNLHMFACLPARSSSRRPWAVLRTRPLRSRQLPRPKRPSRRLLISSRGRVPKVGRPSGSLTEPLLRTAFAQPRRLPRRALPARGPRREKRRA